MQKNITPKEHEAAADIIDYCCGDHTREEIDKYIRSKVWNMTKKERHNIAEIIEAAIEQI